MNYKLIILCQIVFTVHQIFIVYGYSTGAPVESCNSDGMPGHDSILPQPLHTFPYNITVSDYVYKNGTNISIIIEGFHRGFFIRAIDKQTNKTIGNFDTTEEVAPIDECSACTHTNANDKFNTILTWQFTGPSTGDIYFISTVVQNYTTFWVEYVSQFKI